MSPILLDTHVALWAAEGRLAKRVTDAIEDAAARSELLLSPITAWEIGMLVSKRRIRLASTLEEYVRSLFGREGVLVAPLTPAIAATAAALPHGLHRDPADRLLVATAAAYGARFATRDRRIHDYANDTGYIRCLAC